MSLPDQMTDRWQDRPEPAPGEGVVSWHMLMRDYPEVVDLARQAQQRLAGFDGLSNSGVLSAVMFGISWSSATATCRHAFWR